MDLNSTYEREIISMILGDTKGNKEFIINSISPKMFTNLRYRHIFAIIEHLHKSGKEINGFSIIEQLSDEELKELIKTAYTEFITNVNWKFYTDKLKDNYINLLIEQAKTKEELEKVQEEIIKWQDTSSLEHISVGAENLISVYYDSMGTSVKTGIDCLDKKIGSFQGGDLIVLAGATSMGKTAMALQLIKNIAEQGQKVNFYSLEMTKQQIQNRLICSHLKIHAKSFRDFTMQPYEQEAHTDYATKEFKKLPVNICTDYKITTEKIRQIELNSDSNIIFIDYLGLISGGNNKSSYERISDIIRDIKLLALELNKPIFILHQLSRSLFSREDKRPKVSDLRDSGKIEQDADIICFVHRPYYFDKNQDDKLLEFLIAKNRHNESNVICELNYYLQTQQIEERKENVYFKTTQQNLLRKN